MIRRMMRRDRGPLHAGCISLWLLFCLTIAAPAMAQERPQFLVHRAAKPPIIDGSLEDEAWNGSELPVGDFISYDPLYGEKQKQRTEVRVSYDDKNLYFAFHCYDS